MADLKVTLFSKQQMRSDGRTFPKYLATLTRTDGSTLTCQVRFKMDEKSKPDPASCPMNILVNRNKANLAKRALVDKDTGEVFDAFTLWVSEWREGEPYVDHSLDDVI